MGRTGARLRLRVLLVAILLTCSAKCASADTPNQLFVERAYHDLLGRAPDDPGLNAFASALDHGLETNQDVATTITGGDEFHGDEVQQQYQKLLHHPADPLGFNVWVNAMRSGLTVEQLESNLAGSAEYYSNRGGGTDTGFLTVLYPDLLGRSISPSEKIVDEAALSGGESRSNLALSIASSVEYDQHAVNGWFPQYLHRAADTLGRNTFVNEMQAGARDEQVVSQLVGSVEYSRLPFVPGDANFSQSVGFDDLLTLAQNYGHSGAHWFQGDFSGNGTVDFGDLLALAQNYGRTAAVEALGVVPDPSSVFILMVFPVLCRMRRTIAGNRRAGLK